MRLVEHRIEVNDPVANTMTERRIARKNSVLMRCATLRMLSTIQTNDWVIWCNLNEESSMLASMIPDAIEVYGSQSPTIKENLLHKFSRGEARVIISKPKFAGLDSTGSIAEMSHLLGWTIRLRNTISPSDVATDSGNPEECILSIRAPEGAVKENLERKQQMADIMADQMVNHMREFTKREVMGTAWNAPNTT